jgi:Tol biopolymer transport system component
MRGGLVAAAAALSSATLVPAAAQIPPERGLPTVVSLAELVGAGVVSTAGHELSPAFNPDGRTFYFVKAGPAPERHAHLTIVTSRLEEGRWSEPEIAPFSGRHSDLDPWISPDGRRLYFASDRPLAGSRPGDLNLWMMEWSNGGWGRPAVLPHPVNSPADERSPSEAPDGTVYFASDREGGAGSWDLYRARPAPGLGYGPAENLEALNTPGPDVDPRVVSGGGALLFSSPGAGERGAAGDLYLSRLEDGAWAAPVGLDAVNTVADETAPALSPDGRYLYFVSDRPFRLSRSRPPDSYAELESRLSGPGNGLGDVYRILVQHLGVALP